MVRSINWNGQKLLVRVPSKQEINSFKKQKPSSCYSKYLNLVINERLTVNDFSGNINELNQLIIKIKECIE